jgi:hypothetical protein
VAPPPAPTTVDILDPLTLNANLLLSPTQTLRFGPNGLRLVQETIAGYQYHVFYVNGRRFNANTIQRNLGSSSTINLGRILTATRRVEIGGQQYMRITADLSRRQSAQEGGDKISNAAIATASLLGAQDAYVSIADFQTALASVAAVPATTNSITIDIPHYLRRRSGGPQPTDIVVGPHRYERKMRQVTFNAI